MKAGGVARVYSAIKAAWPERLVDPLTEESARLVAELMPPEMTLEHALEVVEDFFRRGSPFPPSWPEITKRWTERWTGTGDDPELIANEWLREVYGEVGKFGGTFYRPMPEFSDPIIAAAVVQAAGSWRGWGETTEGGAGFEGEPFARNLVPERDERFRRAVKAMLRHRAQTGESLPAIVGGSRRALPRVVEDDEFIRRLQAEKPVRELPPGSPFKVPDLSLDRKPEG